MSDPSDEASGARQVSRESPLTEEPTCDYRAVPYRWRKLDVAGLPPTAREGAAVDVDTARDRLLVFGGYEYPAPPGCPYRQDLWELRFSPSPTWKKLDAGSAIPRARAYLPGAFDPGTDSFLVFGGVNWCTGESDVGNPMDWAQTDAWSLAAATDDWSRLHPAGPLPRSRWSLQSVFLPGSRTLVIQGGFSLHPDYLGDTWFLRLDGGGPRWERVAAHEDGPGVRAGAYHWYDPDRGMMVVAGGSRCFGTCPTKHYQDAFGLTGLDQSGPKTWGQLHVTSNVPHPYTGRLCSFDPKAHRAICPRGKYYPGPVDEDKVGIESYDTWTFTFEGPRSGRFDKADTGGTWQAAWDSDLVYDPKRDRFVAFGGAIGTPSAGTFTTTNEVWVLERDWVRASCAPTPVHRP